LAAAKIQRRRPPVSALVIGLVLLVAMAVILVVTCRELEHETDGFSESNVVGRAPTAQSTMGGSPTAPPPPSSLYGWCTGGRASTSLHRGKPINSTLPDAGARTHTHVTFSSRHHPRV